MAMNNKQRLLGGIVLLGGGVLLAAVLLKVQDNAEQSVALPAVVQSVQPQTVQAEPASATMPTYDLQPLAVDVATEQRLLEEQRKAREKAVAEQERRAAEYLAMQQQAEAEAARKAAEEHAAILARRQGQMQSSDNIPPELVEDEKTKQDTIAKRKADDEAKAKKEAEAKRKADDEAKAKKEAEAKRKADDEAKAKKEAEAKRKADDEAKAKLKVEAEAKKKKEAEKARDLLENGDKNWMVQVALAANQANADAITAKLQAKGYKVTQSKTSKGVRIMVKPAGKDREAADAIRKKINADESLNMKGSWVIDWVPLEQR
ncbi:MAG: cell envelope integrity protein TolA [Acinetobacter sp.]|nr:MAG: cell envelope integrity protein TolA [Acinetobacter sp.]